MSLKHRLLEAEEKIKKLSSGGGRGGGSQEGGSPSSSLTETYHPQALGELGVADELLFINEYNCFMDYGYLFGAL